jgi:hypothetical protein
MTLLPTVNSATMSGSALITKVIEGVLGWSAPRYRQIKFSVIGGRGKQLSARSAIMSLHVRTLPLIATEAACRRVFRLWLVGR